MTSDTQILLDKIRRQMMKRARIILFVMAALLASTLACGDSFTPATTIPIVEKSAADINLTVQDLGDDWSLTEETGIEGIGDLEADDVKDANSRQFDSSSSMVMSIVFTTDSISQAEREMEEDISQDFQDQLLTEVPDMTFETLDPPAIGEEAILLKGTHADSGMDIYLLTYRDTNVIVMLMVMSLDGGLSQDQVLDFAQVIEGRIQ
jgi:hypothetical protein